MNKRNLQNGNQNGNGPTGEGRSTPRLLTPQEMDRALHRVIDLEHVGDIAGAHALAQQVRDPAFHIQLHEMRLGLASLRNTTQERGGAAGIPPMRDLTRAIMSEVDLETSFANQPAVLTAEMGQASLKGIVREEVDIPEVWRSPQRRGLRGLLTGTRLAFATGAAATLALVAAIGWMQRPAVQPNQHAIAGTVDDRAILPSVVEPVTLDTINRRMSLNPIQPVAVSTETKQTQQVSAAQRGLGLSIGDTSRYDRTVSGRGFAIGGPGLWKAHVAPSSLDGLSGGSLLLARPSLITATPPSARVSNEPYSLVGLDSPELEIQPRPGSGMPTARESLGDLSSFERNATETGLSPADYLRWYDDPLVGPLLRDPKSRRTLLEAAQQLEVDSARKNK